MTPVIETSPGVFERADLTAVLVRDDGKARAPAQTLISSSWTDGQRARFGLYLIAPQSPPEGQRVTGRSYQRTPEGKVVEVITTEPIPAPVSVTPRQMRLALLQSGLMAQVNAYVATLPEAVTIEWEYATAVERTSPLIAAAANGLGMTQAQVDALFTLASSL